jgi:plastocyanin
MKTPKILVTAAAVLAVAAPAAHAATTKTVTIKTGGFTPAKVAIASGDSITWVNRDTVNRQVVATGGQFASPVIKPGGSWTRQFSVAGTFKYRDTFKSAQTGTIVVSGPPPSVSLAASAPIVTYGGPVTLTGRVSSGRVNEQVIVYGKPYGEVSYVQLATVLTADGGLWSYTTTPALLTSYQAQWNSLKSAEIQAAVEPKLTLKRIGAWFVARVDAARSFKNRSVYVQRRSPLGQWVNIKKVRLGTAKTQRFKLAELPKGTSHLRLFITVNQAGVGYLASSSSVMLVRRA